MNGETFIGNPKKRSGIFYLGGKVKTKKQIEREMPGSILASNMRNNNINRVVMTICGQFMELHKGDKVLGIKQ